MGTTCICWFCGREASEYEIGSSGIYHLNCGEYCGEYEYDPHLLLAQHPQPHWTGESRMRLADALHAGLRRRRFTSAQELVDAIAEVS